MRAIQQMDWGNVDGLRLNEVDRPVPLPTEVLVRVKAASVNPVDVFASQGKAYRSSLSLPFIPGWDVAGVVEQVGYGTTRFKVGDEVYGMPWFPRPASAYAEFVVAPARHFASKPKGISFEAAAAVPLAGLTAWQMLVDIGQIGPGTSVLINGASGGVGHLAIQIAKALGAHVTAVSSTAKHEFMRSLGADAVLDYAQPVSAIVKNMDVVLELVGGDVCIDMLKTVRKGGLLISAQAAWAPGLTEGAAKLGVRSSWYLVEPDHVGLEALTDLIERGALKILVSATFPFERAVEALEQVSHRHSSGKVVLTF